MIEQSTDKGSDTVPTKICRTCGQEKRVTEFGRHAFTADRLHPYCRACRGAAVSAGRRKGREARAPVATAPNQKPLWSEDKRREMVMILVYGFNKQAEVLEQCYGKNTPAFETAMVRVREAFETLFDLLANGEGSGRVTGTATAPHAPGTAGSA